MRMISLRAHGLPVLAAALLLAPWAPVVVADGPPAAAPAAPAAATPAQLFPTREAALEALRAAMEKNDDAALLAMVGSAHADLVQSGKDAFVAKERKRFADLIREKAAWEEIPGALVLAVGVKAFPVPIPLASKDGQWFWDGEAGRDEILARRIGKHELAVIAALRDLVDAQEAYRATDRDGDGVLEYAQKFLSTEGQRDGLYWPEPEDLSNDERSPLGAMLEEYLDTATSGQKGAPFMGYRFRMLKAQGPCTPGGRMSYLQGDNLVGGWAVVAYPDEYRNTGVKSFIISHRGRLFERDLGPQGEALAKAMTEFNPDRTWVRLGNP